MQNPPIPNHILNERIPVWIVLSELFLDTKLTDADYQVIAKRLSESNYSTQEIEDILRFEVKPLLIPNLWSVAGAWQVFDEQWLIEKLTPRINQKPFFQWGLGIIKSDWLAVKNYLLQYRQDRNTK